MLTKEGRHLIAGVDPGFSGGVTVMDLSKNIVFKTVLPLTGVSKDKTIDVIQLKRDLLPFHLSAVFIEKVGSRPDQGVASIFTFGYNAGMLEGLFLGMGISVNFVRPQTWMNEILKGYRREEVNKPSTIFCSRIFPNEDWRAGPRHRVPHDGLTDSCCIALYGVKTFIS